MLWGPIIRERLRIGLRDVAVIFVLGTALFVVIKAVTAICTS